MRRQTPESLFIIIIHALQQGMKSVKVRTADTDVIAILVAMVDAFFDLKLTHPCVDIWVAFGTGKSFEYLNSKAISSHIGVAKARALLMFYALTGCDTTSAFKGRGKKQHGRLMRRVFGYSPIMLLCCMTIDKFSQFCKQSQKRVVLPQKPNY